MKRFALLLFASLLLAGFASASTSLAVDYPGISATETYASTHTATLMTAEGVTAINANSWNSYQTNSESFLDKGADYLAVPGAKAPEPASVALLAVGLLGIKLLRMRAARRRVR
jgi:hypothetical protein